MSHTQKPVTLLPRRFWLGFTLVSLACAPAPQPAADLSSAHRERENPLVVSLLLGATYEYWRARNAFMGEFDWANVQTLIQGHWIFLCACIVGWYTHLLLDGRVRIFPPDQDHH